jgi:hypothetical protein
MSIFDHLIKTPEQKAAALALLREKVDIAEAGLRNARDQYEAEVERQGKPTRGIFSDTFFVRRSSSDRWLAEAENEFNRRKAQDLKEMKANLAKLAAKEVDNNDEEDPNPYPDESGDDNEGDDSPHTPPDKSKKGKKKAAPTDDDVEEAEKAAARFFESRGAGGDDYQSRVNATAAAVVAAAAKARGETPKRPDWEQRQGNHPNPDLRVIPGAPPPPKGSLARQIIDAGRKARNLPPIEED